MNPAPSVIVFSVLSGLGFGYLAVLGLGVAGPVGLLDLGLGLALAVIGLCASTLHLGRPERAWRAVSQWRSSWLSREAVASLAALAAVAVQGIGLLTGGVPEAWGLIVAGLCLATVLCTGMIYAQLATVPRWNHWSVPATFVLFALAGGVLLAGLPLATMVLGLVLAAAVALGFAQGDGRFAARGTDLAAATGLGGIGTPRVFELPHTGATWLTREMIHVVGRKHAQKLRRIALGCLVLASFPLLLLPPTPGIVLGVCLHLAGGFATRWLFFAEAEHVVGLYYGQGARPVGRSQTEG
jgi:sulfite dehydrogenase (quinone) subunit SoeC